MNPSRHHLGLLSALIALLIPACSRVPPPRPPNPTVFSIAETNVVVAAESIPIAPQTRIVRADFNMDGREDMAVEERDAEGRGVVGIYLRRAETLREEYYRAGGIHQSGIYRITALMSTREAQHTELVAMFAFEDGSRDLVQFRSNGAQFEEVSRRHTPAPGSPP